MARPVYIICSESGAEDSLTGLVSHFQVIEKIQVADIRQLPREGDILLVPRVIFRATAVWMREDDDPPEQEFEFETVFYLPPDGSAKVVQNGRFFFATDKPFYRIIAIGQGPPFPAPGLFRVESRVRKIGAPEWIRQDYPIIVEASQATAIPPGNIPSA